MAQQPSDPGRRDQQVNEVIASYLEAEAAGRAPDRQELLARHPDLAAELERFFADHDAVRQLAPPPSPAVPEVNEPEGQSTSACTAVTGAGGRRPGASAP